MIKVTKLNKEVFYINPTLVETAEKTPDTVITLINGKKLVISETLEELQNIIIEYYKVVGMIAPQVVFNSFGFSENEQNKTHANNK